MKKILKDLKRSDVRPVDYDEAKKGEVNYVKVKDWGEENAENFTSE